MTDWVRPSWIVIAQRVRSSSMSDSTVVSTGAGTVRVDALDGARMLSGNAHWWIRPFRSGPFVLVPFRHGTRRP